MMLNDEDPDELMARGMMPNTPRDPEKEARMEKMKAYLQPRMRPDRSAEQPLLENNQNLALINLLNQSANQMGTSGGKAASSQPLDQFTQQTMKGNQDQIGRMAQDRQFAAGEDDRQLKLMQYFEKQNAEAAARGETSKYRQDMLGLRRDEIENQKNARRDALTMKKDEKSEKKALDQAKLNVPGYERTGEVTQTDTEAQKARDATGVANNLIKGLDLLKLQMDESGSFEYGGKSGATMASTANDLRLQAKELYELGVLNGPDLGLMLKQIPDTESMGALFTRDSTAKATLKATAEAMKRKVLQSMSAKGYKAKPGTLESEPDASGSGLKPVEQMSLEELEAELGGG